MEPYRPERNLKANSINRILKDMIQTTRDSLKSGLMVIVVDDYTAKILSSFLTMSEVLNEGVFSVERLLTVRQAYPKYDALYFISPTEKSCTYLANDFKNEKTPQYRRIHIFFSHQIINPILDLIVTQGVVKRVLTCKELNLSFVIRDKNLFDLALPDALKIFTVKNNTKDTYLSIMTERLITICAVLRENPFIRYQATSSIAASVASNLNAQLAGFYEKKSHNDKRGIILIVDRSVDVTTPLLHDYNYEPMIYDLFELNNNELEYEVSKKHKLDDQDDLWMRYKNQHMVHVFQEVTKDFQLFMQSDMSKVHNTDNQTFEEMAGVLQNIKGYKNKTAQFSCHLKLAERITEKYKENNMMDLIELEQEIVTGVTSEGSKVSIGDIFTRITLLKDKITRRDYIRLLMTLHTCLDITEKDFSKYLESLGNDDKAVKNLEWLGVSFTKSKSKNIRRASVLNKGDINRLKLKKQTIEYKFIRSNPKIEGIVSSCSNMDLSKTEFPFVEEPKGVGMTKKKNYHVNADIIGGNDDEEELPYLIVFVIGGIAHNEITALETLYANKALSHHLIVGSTSIINANDYVESIKDLNSPLDITSNNISVDKSVDFRDIELMVRK